MLHHDMSKRFAAQYFPEEYIDDVDYLSRLPSFRNLDLSDETNGWGEISKTAKYIMHPHIVFDL